MSPDPVTIATRVAIALAGPCIKCTKTEIDYIRNYESNTKKVQGLHRDLEDQKDEIQEHVEEGKRQGRKVAPTVKHWLQDELPDFNKTMEQELLKDEEAMKKASRCCFGSCGNPIYRRRWSKKAVKKAEQINTMIRKMNDRGGAQSVTVPTGPPELSNYSRHHYVRLESRENKMDEILECLKVEKHNRIGIWGPGGAGKSTFVDELANRAKQQCQFHKVVVAEISQFPNIKMIQNQIAERFGFTTINEYHTNHERAIRIGEIIREMISHPHNGHNEEEQNQEKQSKRLLLILDDIWKKLDLSLLGIPHELSRDARLTLIITSRSQDVCQKMDATDCTIEVGVLNEEEGKFLFKEKVGDITYTEEHEKIIADFLDGSCRLPLSVNILADILKGKSLPFWRSTIEKTKKSAKEGANEIFDDTYSVIKMSYDLLKGNEEKMIFLFCCLLASRSYFSIHELLKYAIGWGLFEHLSSLSEVIHKAFDKVKELRSLSLVMDFDADKGLIRIHDDVREAGISFAKEGNQMFHIGSIPKWMKEDSYKKYTAFSIVSDNSYEYLAGQELKNLKILRAIGVDDFKLCDGYFTNMKLLKVLHLSNFHMITLPTSIGHLENLETLLIEYCSLEDISLICTLWKLQVLSLKGSKISILPEVIGTLVNLKVLDLTECSWLRKVPAQVLVNLKKLEGLYMRKSFLEWKLGRNSTCLSELKLLHNLQVLEIEVSCVEQLVTRNLPVLELSSYRIHIAVSTPWFTDGSFYHKDLQLNGIHANDLIKKGLEYFVGNAATLSLENIEGLKNLAPYLGIYGLRKLKHLKVSKCSTIESLISMIAVHQMVQFPMLKVLHLEHLPQLVAICHVASLHVAFSTLEEVTLSNLDGLKDCALLAQHATKLKILEVKGCKNLEYIISMYGRTIKGYEKIEFASLQKLHLENLAKLKGVCYQENDEVCSSDEDGSQSLFSIPTQTSQNTLFHWKEVYPHLELMYMSNLDNIEALWDATTAHDMSATLPNLKSVHIHKMKRLKYVWSMELPTGSHKFKNFTEFAICDCDLLESIFSHVSNHTNMMKIQFAKLQTLKMKSLPRCRYFLKGDIHVSFPELRELKLVTLPMMKSFVEVEDTESLILGDVVLFTRKVKFPRIEHLHLYKLDYIFALWDSTSFDDFYTMFSSLQSLYIRYMHKLRHLWRIEIYEESNDVMIHIKEISILDCNSMVSLISATRMDNSRMVQVQFSHLQSVTLLRLSEFKCLMNGEAYLEFPSLKRLYLSSLSKMNTLVGGDHALLQPLFDGQVKFPNLELVSLWYMNNTKRLWNFMTIEEFSNFFPSLQTLRLQGNQNLRYVWDMVLQNGSHLFRTLKEISIDRCNSMESLLPPVVLANNTPDVKVIFPRLQSLKLRDLKKFKALLQGDVDMESTALRNLHLEKLFELETLVSKLHDSGNQTASDHMVTISLFNRELVLPCLESLDLSAARKVKTLWVGTTCDQFNSKYPSLRNLKVAGMGNLKHLWSYDDNGYNWDENQRDNYFASLATISIDNCRVLESLFSPSRHDHQQPRSSRMIHTPKLEALTLVNLTQFKCLVPGTSGIEFQALKYMIVHSLPKLKTLIRLQKSSRKEIQKGEKGLKIHEEENQDKDEDDGPALFNFNSENIVGFPSLERLTINFKICNTKEDAVTRFIFPELKQLDIASVHVKNLPRALIQNVLSLNIRYIHELKYIVATTALSHLVPTDDHVIFTSLSGLQKMEQLFVWDCHSLVELFLVRDDEDVKPLLNLRELGLWRNQKLKPVPWEILPNTKKNFQMDGRHYMSSLRSFYPPHYRVTPQNFWLESSRGIGGDLNTTVNMANRRPGTNSSSQERRTNMHASTSAAVRRTSAPLPMPTDGPKSTESLPLLNAKASPTKPTSDKGKTKIVDKTMRSACHDRLVDDRVFESLGTNLRRLHDLIKKRGDDLLELQLDMNIFHYEVNGTSFNGTSLLHKEDMIQMLNGEWLNITIMHIFIMYLVNDMNEAKMNQFAFMCPDNVSHQNWTNNKTTNFATYFAEVVKKCSNKKYILIPYHQRSHWNLLVLCPSTSQMLIFDSLGDTAPTIEIKEDVSLAFDAGIQTTGAKKDLVWISVKCPRQPGGVECGYYIMRFMYDIINTFYGAEELEKEFENVGDYNSDIIDSMLENWVDYVLVNLFKINNV